MSDDNGRSDTIEGSCPWARALVLQNNSPGFLTLNFPNATIPAHYTYPGLKALNLDYKTTKL